MAPSRRTAAACAIREAKLATRPITGALRLTTGLIGQENSHFQLFHKANILSTFCQHFRVSTDNFLHKPAKCASNSTIPPNPAYFSDDFHVYGFRWTASEIIVSVDGQTAWSIPNKCLNQPLNLVFDRETMPDWYGLPSFAVLPDQPFEIDYVRTSVPPDGSVYV